MRKRGGGGGGQRKREREREREIIKKVRVGERKRQREKQSDRVWECMEVVEEGRGDLAEINITG